jgi:hypothetical protein
VLQLRRYKDADASTVWRLHDEGMRQAEAHAGDGPWDDDLRSIRSSYLENRGEFLIGELDYTTLRLDTTVGQRRARRLYESSGYREVGRTTDPTGCEVVLYEKPLTPRSARAGEPPAQRR